jgi:hypothetical protein
LVFTGIAFAGRWTRSPVGVEESFRVNRLFGKGSRHGFELNGWQSAAGGLELVAPADGTSVAAAAAAMIRRTPMAAEILRDKKSPLCE